MGEYAVRACVWDRYISNNPAHIVCNIVPISTEQIVPLKLRPITITRTYASPTMWVGFYSLHEKGRSNIWSQCNCKLANTTTVTSKSLVSAIYSM